MSPRHITPTDPKATRQFREAVAARIRTSRQHAGLTQRALAVELGCSDTTVTYWETGRNMPSLEALRRIAAVLGTTIAHLAGEDQ